MKMPEPEYKYIFNSVRVTFYKTTQETTQEIKKISTRNKIIEALEKNNSLTREDLAKLTNVSSNAIKQQLAKLKKEGRIKRIGSTKTGHWRVIDKITR
ncbi:MAG: winged helix-turn-helix transcriptional regulator [Bacteroidales bacterium]|nr:winged helix-turn-helix transcriptional regulator [Bacteroidales bacterium]